MQWEKEKLAIVDDQIVWRVSIFTDTGMRFQMINYGATITSIQMPDKEGKLAEIILGFEDVADYIEKRPYFGATVGPVAGRIAEGNFDLAGQSFSLDQNENGNTLHSGAKSIDQQVWQMVVTQEEKAIVVHFRLKQIDGQNGFPGNRKIEMTHTFTADNQWQIRYQFESDQPTLWNPTNHVYFNLSGDYQENILQQKLQLNSEKFAVLDQQNLPTGELRSVVGTAFDFTESIPIVQGAESHDEQNQQVGGGFDHPFLLTHHEDEADGILTDEKSGRKLAFSTDCDAVVIYTYNQAPTDLMIRDVQAFDYMGITFETQQLPDAIHHEDFGNIVIEADKVYESRTSYRFFI